jgi:hypothetical protein
MELFFTISHQNWISSAFCGHSASRITFTENFGKIAAEQCFDIRARAAGRMFFIGMPVHQMIPWYASLCCGRWGDREIAIIESHRFRFVRVWVDGLPRLDGPVRMLRPTANDRNPCQPLAPFGSAGSVG